MALQVFAALSQSKQLPCNIAQNGLPQGNQGNTFPGFKLIISARFILVNHPEATLARPPFLGIGTLCILFFALSAEISFAASKINQLIKMQEKSDAKAQQIFSPKIFSLNNPLEIRVVSTF